MMSLFMVVCCSLICIVPEIRASIILIDEDFIKEYDGNYEITNTTQKITTTQEDQNITDYYSINDSSVVTQLYSTTAQPQKTYEIIQKNTLSEIYTIPEENENSTVDQRLQENWDCSRNEIENKQGLVTISGMIKKAEEELNHQQNQTKNTILVLGNAGAGKTTFVQFMVGDNSKLISKETRIGSGNFLIEDGVKIGNSVTESFTLYPEQLPINAETSFTDTPGFSDTRSEKHEVVETYVMKRYMKKIDNYKIVLIVPFTSLELGTMYKDDFVSLLQNIDSFINDIHMYRDSIALVATKVPNMYKKRGTNVALVSDDIIIKSIADYLKLVQKALKEKLENSSGEIKKTKFLQNAIKVLEYLSETDENGNYKKINIFRQPSEEGTLSSMESFQEQKKSLYKTVLNNIVYANVSYNDVGYSLSDKAKIYLNCLLWHINENIRKMSLYIFHTIENHYAIEIQNFVDVYALKSKLEHLVKKLKTFKSDLKESHNYKNYTSLIKNYIVSEKIETYSIDNETLFEVFDYINNIEQFTNTGSILSPLEWAEQMKTLLNYIKDNLSWCNLLIKSFEHFSSYEIQKSKSRFSNITNFNQTQVDIKNLLLLNRDESFLQDNEFYRNLLLLNGERSLEINNLISQVLLKPNNISCDNEGKLILVGNYIKLSEINETSIIEKLCKQQHVKIIVLFAIDTIFIDADLNDEYFRGISIMIAAPKWEIIGKRIINISGISGKNHNNSKADDALDLGENGTDGMPGNPGGNGGNFIGIGLYFKNDDRLTIEANGGTGGSGQDGGNGKVGQRGKEGYEKFQVDPPNDTNYFFFWQKGHESMTKILDASTYEQNDSWIQHPLMSTMKAGHCSANIKFYKKVGDCGKVGGNGGNGGLNGLGGYPGRIIFTDGDAQLKSTLYNSKGIPGNPGQGGNAGRKGANGKTIECYKTTVEEEIHECSYRGSGYYRYDSSSCQHRNCGPHKDSFWKCRFLNDWLICSDNVSSAGLSNYTSTGLMEPKQPQENDFSKDLYNYISLLKENENNKFFNNITLKLREQINKNISSMKTQFFKSLLLLEAK